MARSNSAYTLIEILIVLGIILVATTIFISVINPLEQMKKARDARRKSDLDQVKKALVVYYNDYLVYPATAAFPSWGSAFTQDGQTYMKTLPHDPQFNPATGVPEYSYQQASGGENFCLMATLEILSDSDIAASQTRCSGVCVPYDPTSDYLVCLE